MKTNNILTLVVFCDSKHLKHYKFLSQIDLMQSMEIWMQDVEYENLFLLVICGNQYVLFNFMLEFHFLSLFSSFSFMFLTLMLEKFDVNFFTHDYL